MVSRHEPLHNLNMIDGETAWVHAVMVSYQARAAIAGSTAARKIGVFVLLGYAERLLLPFDNLKV